jgi:membrane-associated phospholipid phosphatase
MTVASPPARHSEADLQRGRAARASALLTMALLALATWPLWSTWRDSGLSAPLVTHLVVLGAALVALTVRRLGPVRDWLPLLAVPVLYVELRWIIAAVGIDHRDATVLGWEAALFPSNPSATLAVRFHGVVLSEALHLAYACYYALVAVPPLVLYLRGARREFAATVLALTFVYAVCFVVYPFFPVDGPRFLVGPAAAPEGPVRALVLALLEGGSSRGTAFPSSHVAASVVSALCALQYQRRIGVAVALAAAALTVATVYGGFHYAVDAAAGLALGVAAWVVSRAVWRMAGPSARAV